METRAPYAVVGGFVLVILAGLVVAVLWFAQRQFGEQANHYDIYFTGSVTGLTAGSTVRYNGVPVGRVAEIRLDPADPSRVRITVEIGGGVAIKTDTVASLEFQGLAGGLNINLSGGTRDSPDLARKDDERYPVIASRQSGLQQVVSSAPELLGQLVALADKVGDLLSDQNRKDLSDTLGNLRRLTEAASSRSDEISSAIDDGAQTLKGLRTTLDSANAILAALRDLITPQGDMAKTLRSIDETSHRYADLAQHLDAVIAQNGPQLHDFTQHGFEELTQLVQQSQQLVAQLSRIADAVERDPSRFLYGDRREGYSPK